MEDFEAAEEIFGEKEEDPAVFLELLSSCRFPPVSLNIGELVSADLEGLLPRGRARDGNGHPEVLRPGPSASVLLVGHGVGAHFGFALDVEDCLVETVVGEGEELKRALEADFEDNMEEEPLW